MQCSARAALRGPRRLHRLQCGRPPSKLIECAAAAVTLAPCSDLAGTAPQTEAPRRGRFRRVHVAAHAPPQRTAPAAGASAVGPSDSKAEIERKYCTWIGHSLRAIRLLDCSLAASRGPADTRLMAALVALTFGRGPPTAADVGRRTSDSSPADQLTRPYLRRYGPASGPSASWRLSVAGDLLFRRRQRALSTRSPLGPLRRRWRIGRDINFSLDARSPLTADQSLVATSEPPLADRCP